MNCCYFSDCTYIYESIDNMTPLHQQPLNNKKSEVRGITYACMYIRNNWFQIILNNNNYGKNALDDIFEHLMMELRMKVH